MMAFGGSLSDLMSGNYGGGMASSVGQPMGPNPSWGRPMGMGFSGPVTQPGNPAGGMGPVGPNPGWGRFGGTPTAQANAGVDPALIPGLIAMMRQRGMGGMGQRPMGQPALSYADPANPGIDRMFNTPTPQTQPTLATLPVPARAPGPATFVPRVRY